MKKHDGGPAFPTLVPIVHVAEQGKDYPVFDDAGMTLRDYFAAQAIVPFMARLQNPTPSATTAAKACAEWAYELADAMLVERQK